MSGIRCAKATSTADMPAPIWFACGIATGPTGIAHRGSPLAAALRNNRSREARALTVSHASIRVARVLSQTAYFVAMPPSKRRTSGRTRPRLGMSLHHVQHGDPPLREMAPRLAPDDAYRRRCLVLEPTDAGRAQAPAQRRLAATRRAAAHRPICPPTCAQAVSRAGGHAVRHRVMSTVVERSSPTTARGAAPAVASTCTYDVGGGQRRHSRWTVSLTCGMGSGNHERSHRFRKRSPHAPPYSARGARCDRPARADPTCNNSEGR